MSVPSGTIRVFLLEDNPDDVEIELYQLRKAGLEVEHAVARNRREFQDRLRSFRPDIILADYALPDLTGTEAIELCGQWGLDVPVILITGEGNEQIAVDSLRQGAVDYILKRNIAGLGARVLRALEIVNDRRAKRRAEREEQRLQEVLYETKKMEAIGRLAGGIAHDFNNILTGIIGFADLGAKEAGQNASLAGKFQSIVSFSQRGADVVKQLMIFSRKMPLEFAETEINLFVREITAFLRRIVGETIEIRLELIGEPAYVRCDRGQMTQMMMNLVLNARDAMKGLGIITIRTGRGMATPGEIAADEGAKECVLISVSDTGVGIDERDLTNIFEPFYTTKDPGKGTGLGLSIVYSVVKSHGGSVRVESEKGKGATFRISLPLVTARTGEEISPFYERLPDRPTAHYGKGETILIAEDEEELRDLLSSYLGSSGYNVVVASDGEEALDIYRAGSAKIDLVISDMRMPNMGGIELFHAVRKINPEGRFMLVTGYSLSEVEESDLGRMNAVLIKPYTPTQLGEVVARVLR